MQHRTQVSRLTIVCSLLGIILITSFREQGISISLATIDQEKYLVAFGGYNGKYNNEVCSR